MQVRRAAAKRRPGCRLRQAIERSAVDTIRAVISDGERHYDRRLHLPRLLPLGPEELADESPQGRQRILALLGRALRAERSRGKAGHWTYDLNRHLALAQAHAAERRLAGAAAKTGRADCKTRTAAGMPAAASGRQK